MTTSIYDKNTALLKRFHPYLRLKRGITQRTITETTKDGLVTLKLSSGRYVYSPRNPIQTAERMTSELLDKRFDMLVIVGFGLGYHINQIIKKKKDDNFFLLILEPVTENFLLSLQYIDLETILTYPKILLWVGETTQQIIARFDDFFNPIFIRRIETFRHPIIYDEYKIAYSQEEERVKNRIDIRVGSAMTMSRFGKRWTQNIINNIPEMLQKKWSRISRGVFKLDNVIVAGSGPSLDDSIPFILNHRQKTVVAAVDSALIPLQTAGIIPDIVLSIDPQEECARFFEIPPANKTLFCTSLLSPSSVFNKNYFLRGLFETGHPLERFILGSFAEDIETGGGSVTNVLLEMLIMNNPKRIILAGVDLGFPDNSRYVRGITFGGVDKFASYENTIYKSIFESTCPPIKNNEGKMILTTYALNRYRICLEEVIASHPEIEFIQTSSRGAYINGTRFLRWNEINIKNTSYKGHFLNKKETLSPDVKHIRKKLLEILAYIDKHSKENMEINAILETLMADRFLAREKDCPIDRNVIEIETTRAADFLSSRISALLKHPGFY